MSTNLSNWINGYYNQGYTGSRGYAGSQGAVGYIGSKGVIGFTGSRGYTGSQGKFVYTAQSTAPSTPNPGDEWWDTDDGNFYKYLNDGTGSQWVEWGPNNSLNGNELITGNLIPDLDATHDIGSSSKALSSIYANDFIGVASSAKYADLAEKFLADAEYPIGTVMMIGGEAEVTAAVAEKSAIVGVISTKPAYLMNNDLTGENAVAIAYIGRVMCRVTGTVQCGDCLVASSMPGVAISEHPNNILPGTMIGKALQAYSGSSEGLIEIIVGRL